MHVFAQRRRLPLLLGLGLAVVLALGILAVPAAFGQATPTTSYTTELSPMNDSGAEGTVTITRESDTAIAVSIEATGLSPGLPHAQHLHGSLDVENTCPPASADTDGDGYVSVAEGVPFYGPIQLSLTTEGPTDTPLALDRFPVADENGNLSYERTIEVSEEIASSVAHLHVVQHGIDIDDSGAYDGDKPSSIAPDVPFEATVPAACGELALGGVGETMVERIAGETRIETAVEVSQVAFPEGSETVHLARADVFADALAAGPLTDAGPILLVPSCDDVPQAVLDEVQRLDPTTIRVLGGSAAVCDDVVAEVAGALQ